MRRRGSRAMLVDGCLVIVHDINQHNAELHVLELYTISPVLNPQSQFFF